MSDSDTYGLPDLEFVLFAGYDVTGMVRGLSDELTSPTEDATTAGDKLATSQFVGTSQATLALTAFYDEDLSPRLEGGPSGVLMYALQGNDAGVHCECVEEAVCSGYKRAPDSAGVHKAETSFACQGDVALLDHALIVAALAARTAAGNTKAAYVDSGAATTDGGGRWWVHVTGLTLSGCTNVSHQLVDSADHITFGDVTGAVATFTAVGAQMVAFSGAVDQYLADVWSYAGSGGSPSNTAIAAVTKLPDA